MARTPFCSQVLFPVAFFLCHSERSEESRLLLKPCGASLFHCWAESDRTGDEQVRPRAVLSDGHRWTQISAGGQLTGCKLDYTVNAAEAEFVNRYPEVSRVVKIDATQAVPFAGRRERRRSDCRIRQRGDYARAAEIAGGDHFYFVALRARASQPPI